VFGGKRKKITKFERGGYFKMKEKKSHPNTREKGEAKNKKFCLGKKKKRGCKGKRGNHTRRWGKKKPKSKKKKGKGG